MIWQSPWALLGLFTLALPVLIHLLSRTQAVVQKFPTLRFLDVSRLLPTRSPRITDVPLLLVRLGIFAAAVIALAAPLFVSANRARAFNATVARAIVVDTSRSVVNSGVGGVDSITAQATGLARDAGSSALLRTTNVGEATGEAVAWLATQPGRGEVVVLSDFQSSSVDSATLAAIPKQYGVKLIRVALSAPGAPRDSVPGTSMRTQSSVVEITSEPTRTVAEWSLPVAATSDAHRNVELLASDADKALVESAREAATQVAAPPPGDSSMPVAIVYAGAGSFAALAKSAQPLNAAWMGSVVQQLQGADDFQDAINSADVASDSTMATPWFVLGRNASGIAVAFAARASVNNAERLVMYARMRAGTAASAQLIAAVQRVVAQPWNVSEHETRTLSDATLASLQREAGQVAPQRVSSAAYATSGASDSRWFWGIAVVLLLVESYMRRERRIAASGLEVAA